jgi:hypothetical protein
VEIAQFDQGKLGLVDCGDSFDSFPHHQDSDEMSDNRICSESLANCTFCESPKNANNRISYADFDGCQSNLTFSV